MTAYTYIPTYNPCIYVYYTFPRLYVHAALLIIVPLPYLYTPQLHTPYTLFYIYIHIFLHTYLHHQYLYIYTPHLLPSYINLTHFYIHPLLYPHVYSYIYAGQPGHGRGPDQVQGRRRADPKQRATVEQHRCVHYDVYAIMQVLCIL